MKKFSPILILSGLFCSGCAQFAGPPPLIPREILFGNPAKKDPQISPNGKHLSYLAPDKNNVLQIWLRSLNGSDDRQLTSEEKRGIQHYTWAYDGQHLIFARETNGDEDWQIITVDIVSKTVRNLTPYKGVRSLLVGLSPHEPENILVAMNLRNRRFFDVYRINLQTSDTRMVNRNGGAQSWWVADQQLNVRVASAFAGTIVRERQGQPWRVARKWHPAEFGRYLSLSPDGQTFFMSGSHSGEVGALMAVDLATGNETVLASDPQYDVEDAFVHPLTREVQAVGFYREKLAWQTLDRTVAEDFRRLEEFRSGEFTVLHPPYESPIVYSSSLGRRDLQDQTWIVSYDNDQRAKQHYLYHRDSKALTFLFGERPALEQYRLAPMKPITYQARDGLQIHGYLTLPLGSAAMPAADGGVCAWRSASSRPLGLS